MASGTTGPVVAEWQQDITQLRRQLAELQDSVQGLVSALVWIVTTFVGALLATALVVPIIQISVDRHVESYAMLRVIGAGFNARNQDGGTDESGIFVGTVYLVLAVVVVAAVVSLVAVADQRGNKRRASWGTAVAVVLLLGTGGAWLMSLLDSGQSWWRVQPGLLLLTAAAIFFAAVMFSFRFADWWVDSRPADQDRVNSAP